MGGMHQKAELQWQKNGWQWRLLRDHTGWADATVDARVSQALAVSSAVRPENFRPVRIAV